MGFVRVWQKQTAYWNLDGMMLVLLFWLFLWFSLTSRLFETALLAFRDGQLRLPAAASLVFSIPMIWYCCIMPIHYFNDRWYPMLPSQLFFTITDLFSAGVTLMHLRRDRPVVPFALMGAAGIAVAHVVELAIDEPFFISGSLFSGGTVRNLLFVMGDCINFAWCWNLLKSMPGPGPAASAAGRPPARVLSSVVGVACGLLCTVQLILYRYPF